jgi:hypothetical protein
MIASFDARYPATPTTPPTASIFHGSKQTGAIKALSKRRLHRLRARDVLPRAVDQQVCGLNCTPHDTFSIQVRDNALCMPSANISSALATQLWPERLVTLHELLSFMES